MIPTLIIVCTGAMFFIALFQTKQMLNGDFDEKLAWFAGIFLAGPVFFFALVTWLNYIDAIALWPHL